MNLKDFERDMIFSLLLWNNYLRFFQQNNWNISQKFNQTAVKPMVGDHQKPIWHISSSERLFERWRFPGILSPRQTTQLKSLDKQCWASQTAWLHTALWHGAWCLMAVAYQLLDNAVWTMQLFCVGLKSFLCCASGAVTLPSAEPDHLCLHARV